MTKVINKIQKDDMQMHILNAYDIIDKHLPSPYVEIVLAKLPVDSVTKATIRSVRADKTRAAKKLSVLNALVEVALEHKREVEKLIQLTSDNHDNI